MATRTADVETFIGVSIQGRHQKHQETRLDYTGCTSSLPGDTHLTCMWAGHRCWGKTKESLPFEFGNNHWFPEDELRDMRYCEPEKYQEYTKQGLPVHTEASANPRLLQTSPALRVSVPEAARFFKWIVYLISKICQCRRLLCCLWTKAHNAKQFSCGKRIIWTSPAAFICLNSATSMLTPAARQIGALKMRWLVFDYGVWSML